jgi:hypothetical protein
MDGKYNLSPQDTKALIKDALSKHPTLHASQIRPNETEKIRLSNS